MLTIGWIGTGVMGLSMAQHLQNAGYKLIVYTRTKTKAQTLIDNGAIWAETPAILGAQSDIVFTMVGYPHDVEEVYLDPKNGLLTNPSCKVIVDMSTSSPELAIAIAEAASKKGISSLDAPVSGGDIGAKNATLAIMVGGEEETFNQVKPLFEIMGKNIQLMGSHGAGQHTKMCNQILIASTMIGTCEALIYAAEANLDEEQVINIIGSGAAGSWSINNLGPRIIKGDFAPGFYIEHFLKDMGIALEECRKQNINLPGLSLAYDLYRTLFIDGHGRSGTQALYLALKNISKTRLLNK